MHANYRRFNLRENKATAAVEAAGEDGEAHTAIGALAGTWEVHERVAPQRR